MLKQDDIGLESAFCGAVTRLVGAGGKADNPVADLEPCHIGSDGNDMTGDVGADDGWVVQIRGHQVARGLHQAVHRVYSYRTGADDNLLGPRLWKRRCLQGKGGTFGGEPEGGVFGHDRSPAVP